jgi:DNA-binding MarR family transcriptional regulator
MIRSLTIVMTVRPRAALSADPAMVPGAILARVSRLHLGWKRYVQQQLLPFRVSPKQLFVLRALDERGFLLPSEIARMVHADRPTVSSMVRTMERAGWVALEGDPDDGRRRRVVLRAAGRELLRRIPARAWRSGKTRVDPEACLSRSERRVLHELLGRMSRAIEETP